MTKERVVVTGIGVVSSVGIGKDEFWHNITNGKSGVKLVTRVPEQFRSACLIGAEISNFDPLKWLEPKQAKRTDRFIQFAVAASRLAVDDAKLDFANEDPERVGVVVGSAAGGFESIELQ